MLERTLILIKPDGVKRHLTGEILSRFERAGLKIIAMKMVYVKKEFALNHYPVTEVWYKKVGTNTLEDSKKYNISAKETIGTEDPLEIGKKVHTWNVEFLTSGPVTALVLEGFHAIETARKIAGATLPNLAMPGTIRGDLSTHSALSANIHNKAIPNLVHTSGDRPEAEREIKLWFQPEELHIYKSVHD
ncbi:MAG TPA: nucleoside-diphosphate kinase [Candidatus Nanoarchaeia archaeon]|nr:nucleoside-diphosphate kinase [Candidatus Nanoarchaeia archaeon]